MKLPMEIQFSICCQDGACGLTALSSLSRLMTSLGVPRNTMHSAEAYAAVASLRQLLDLDVVNFGTLGDAALSCLVAGLLRLRFLHIDCGGKHFTQRWAQNGAVFL